MYLSCLEVAGNGAIFILYAAYYGLQATYLTGYGCVLDLHISAKWSYFVPISSFSSFQGGDTAGYLHK